MLSKYKTFLLLLSLLSGMAVYSQKLYKPSPADAQRSGIPVDTLNRGRKLYVNNCSSCHALFMPGQYSTKEWETIVPRMQKKAKITDQEAKAILNYLKSGTDKK